MKKRFLAFSLVVCLVMKLDAVIVQNNTSIALSMSFDTGEEDSDKFQEIKPGEMQDIDIKVADDCSAFAVKSKKNMHIFLAHEGMFVIHEGQESDPALLRFYEASVLCNKCNLKKIEIIVEYRGEKIGRLPRENFEDKSALFKNKSLVVSASACALAIGLAAKVLVS